MPLRHRLVRVLLVTPLVGLLFVTLMTVSDLPGGPVPAQAAPAATAPAPGSATAPTTTFRVAVTPDSAAVRRARHKVAKARAKVRACRRTTRGTKRTRCVRRAKRSLATAKRHLRKAVTRQTRTRRARATCRAQGRPWWEGHCQPLPANPARRTLVTARGGDTARSTVWTWPAYRSAIAGGVDRLQATVRFSSDRVAFVHPSSTVGAPCQNGAPLTQGDPSYPYVGKQIRRLTSAQLDTLECGSVGAPNGTAAGSRMLRVSQLVERAQALSPAVGFDLEVPRDASNGPLQTQLADLAKAVTALDAPSRLTISSTDWSVPAGARSVAGLTGAARVGIDPGTGSPDRAVQLGLTGISAPHWVAGRRYLTRARVAALHAHGLDVEGRVGSEPFGARNLALAGADSAATARPGQARSELAGVKEPLAPTIAVTSTVTPLTRAHSHNDYTRRRPLLDALDLGFQSVEVDLYLIDGELRVGHSVAETVPGRTLASLYLDPLAARVRDGSILGRGVPFHLLVEIKQPTAAERQQHPTMTFASSSQTWQAIESALAAPTGLVTQYSPTVAGPVRASISGSRPKEEILATAPRHAGIDGDPADIARGWTSDELTLVSEADYVGWNGGAPMSASQQALYFGRVQQTHAAGYPFRFYGSGLVSTPTQRIAIWSAQYDLGYDLLNADDLPALATVLRNRSLT